MTTDDELHQLGSEPVHLVPPAAVQGLGLLLDSDFLIGVGVGMMFVLLFGSMRMIDTYRWRVRE